MKPFIWDTDFHFVGKVRFYVVRAGEEVPDEVAKIVGVEPSVRSNVNIVAFVIEGGVIEPSDLKDVVRELEKVKHRIDFSKPVIVSGRGPLWLYGVLVHELHYGKIVAVWDPRLGGGIIVEAPSQNEIGKVITISGDIEERSLGANGDIVLDLENIDGEAVLHVKIVGDRFAEPEKLRDLRCPVVSGDKILVIEGPMPVWLASYLALQYAHKAKAVAIFDPRLGGGVVVASHVRGLDVGDIVKLPSKRPGQTKIIAVLGDPNSGKSVFLHVLNDVLRQMGLKTLIQEADLTAPTPHWSLFSPEVRKELKKYMKPEERLQWVIRSLESLRNSGEVDVVLADVGGGRPDLGQRITRENLAILRYVTGAVIVTRNDKNQIASWLREIKTYFPDLKIYAILESKLTGEPVLVDGVGIVTGLDRTLYRLRAIPRGTVRVIKEVAERILRNKYYIARNIDISKIEQILRDIDTARSLPA